jgi:putative ABC transport system permease protein
VTGVVGEIPQPSHIGRSATAVLRFDVLASWDIIEKLQEIARTTLRGPNTPPPPEYWLNQDCCTTYALLPANGRLDPNRFKAGLATFAARHAPKQQLSGATLEFGAAPVKSLMTDGLNRVLFSGGDAGVSITTILLLLGALVLVVAGLNYANLAAARTATRASEVGIRKVVGASRSQVMTQYLLEAGMLTAVSLVLALVIVEVLSPVIRASTDVDPSFVLFSGLEFWAFVIALLIVVSLAAGAYPAFVLSRVRPVQALRGSKSRTGSRFLSALFVGVQFATAGFLLIAVIVMYQQNRDLTRTALGTNEDPVVELPNVPFFTHVNPSSFRDQLIAMPGIKSISSVGDIPWTANVSLIPFRRSQTAASAPRNAYQNIVDYDFFKTLGMSVIAGRVFDREHGGDLLPQGNQPLDPAHPLTLVIDRAYAKELGFASPDAAVGKMIYLVPQTEKDTPQPARIIGVVENKPLHLMGDGVTSNAYLLGGNQYYVLVRLSHDNVAAGVKAIHEVWDRQAPNIATTVSFMDTLFGQGYETFNRINDLFNGLALFTLVISAMGLFGMAIQATSRRIKEIGIRKSLGASTAQVLRMLVTDFSKPVVIANLIAWPAAFYAAERYLSIFIQRVALTPMPFVLSLAITLVIAWVAVGVHALRAARVKPANVLRYE